MVMMAMMTMMANKHGNDGSSRFVPFGPQQTNMAMMAAPRTTTTRPLQVCGKIFLNTLAIKCTGYFTAVKNLKECPILGVNSM